MRVFVTGDLHGEIDMLKLSVASFPEQKELTKDDFIIICGDFGCIWEGGKRDEYLLNWLESKNFTTLFVDGNHENFNLLNSYPVESWHGGNIHRVSQSVIHLMRGQIFEISGLTFFTMGGASSHDKAYRREGISWWPEELPSDSEYEEAITNLDKHNWEVDFVLTHCAPDSVMNQIAVRYEHDKLTNFLEAVRQDLTYDWWFFGHYHTNKNVTQQDICLYEQIVNVTSGNESAIS